MINQDELKRLFSYDPDTGDFTRKLFAGGHHVGEIPKSINKDGYYQLRVNFKMYVQHRLAWLYVNGEFPDNDIDHINHIRTDNRICNLRDVSKSENNKNISIRSDNTSGVNGVWWCKVRRRWVVELRSNGVKFYIGVFKDITTAESARLEADIKHDFHINHGK